MVMLLQRLITCTIRMKSVETNKTMECVRRRRYRANIVDEVVISQMRWRVSLLEELLPVEIRPYVVNKFIHIHAQSFMSFLILAQYCSLPVTLSMRPYSRFANVHSHY